MENRDTKTFTQGGGPPVRQPPLPTFPSNIEEPSKNPFLNLPQGQTPPAPSPTTPLSTATESDKAFYEAFRPDVSGAVFDVIRGNDYEGPPPPARPLQPPGPPAPYQPVDIMTRSQYAQAQGAKFCFVGGNRYRSTNNQTQNPPGSNAS